MADIRDKCNLFCTAHDSKDFYCDDSICLKRKAYLQGYQDGGSDMEQAKQIIIDGLLKQIRAEAIDEYRAKLNASMDTLEEKLKNKLIYNLDNICESIRYGINITAEGLKGVEE